MADECSNFLDLLTVTNAFLSFSLPIFDDRLVLGLHRLMPELALVGDLSLLEVIEVLPDRCVMPVLSDEVTRNLNLLFELGLVLQHGGDELLGLLLVVDHVLDLQLDAVLVLARVPRCRVQHALVASGHAPVVLLFDVFDHLFLLVAQDVILLLMLVMTKHHGDADLYFLLRRLEG